MKEETQQSQGNTGNHGRGVFASGRKWALRAKSSIETALCQRITGTNWKKVLANRRKRKIITKKAHAGRGLETIWEIPGYIVWGVIAMVAFRIYQDFQKRR
jgi:hypothetical protein